MIITDGVSWMELPLAFGTESCGLEFLKSKILIIIELFFAAARILCSYVRISGTCTYEYILHTIVPYKRVVVYWDV